MDAVGSVALLPRSSFIIKTGARTITIPSTWRFYAGGVIRGIIGSIRILGEVKLKDGHVVDN